MVFYSIYDSVFRWNWWVWSYIHLGIIYEYIEYIYIQLYDRFEWKYNLKSRILCNSCSWL